ncbi:protein transport protein Sec16A isoform X2 [Pseudophryne corroboree]|uniref:protein transport protein Sec16A isoform X2 n=1 Tax=Pseudophryne corroboree TaxID=495146 RepID=UPI003081CF26
MDRNMQPPPQAGPPATGGPPRMPMTTNAYWRKRTPAQTAMAPPQVQPVTDPFAFGRMTPQNLASGSAPRANVLPMQSPSPSLYPQPTPPTSAAGESASGAQGPMPGFPSPSMATYSGVPSLPAPSFHYTNSMAPTPAMQPGVGRPAASSLHNTTSGLENAFMPLPDRSQSRQSINTEMGHSYMATQPQSYTPPSSQQTTAPWATSQAAPPTSAQSIPPPAQHPAYNASHYSLPYLEVSHLPPQNPAPAYFSAPQRPAPAAFPHGAGAGHVQQHGHSQFSNPIQTDYMQHQSVEQNSWYSQPYREPQSLPPLPNPNPVQAGAPLTLPGNRPQSESATAPSHVSSDADSGTISMFFKGDEAENVEILSTDQQHGPRRPAADASHHPNVGHQGSALPLQTQPAVAHAQSHPPMPLNPTAPNTQSFLSHEPHAAWQVDDADNQPAELKVLPGPPYDNVENVECVQNLEVLPSEPHKNNLFSTSVNPEAFRYGPVPCPTLPKNVASHAEGGNNLEAPDVSPHPVRSDSVSSNYSNLSHKSLPAAARPLDQGGTFIQKESGRLENETANSFFKQIDCSPLGGDNAAPSLAQNAYQSNLSHPPTPSPPKPTGIFQASANSSFEPVRSHIGVKSAELDYSKVVGEIPENCKLPPNPSHNTIPAASPGNLEQPPDNLETIFSGKSDAEVCAVNSGQNISAVGGPPFDNLSLLLDKRPSSRAHGSNKKCESPATTLWAQGELPNFGGNVLLAPPAPVLYVPPKAQTEVIQPPEDGSRSDQAQFSVTPEEYISSENLENPPKIGDEEHPHSQASSGYASLLSSPPTDSLQNQPVLIAQPNKSYNLVQPINFSLSLPNQMKNSNSAKDLSAGDKSAPAGSFAPDHNASFSANQPGAPLKAPISSNQINKLLPGNDHFSDSVSNHPQNIVLSASLNQIPLNLATESQKAKFDGLANESANRAAVSGPNMPVSNGAAMFVPAVTNSSAAVSHASSLLENSGALDFTVPRAPANHSANSCAPIQNRPQAGGPVYPNHSANVPNFQPMPDIYKQGFYQQVANDVRAQPAVETSQPGAATFHEYMTPVSQTLPTQATAEAKPISYLQQAEAQMPSTQHSTGSPYSGTSESGPKPVPPEQPPYPTQPATTSSAPVNPNHYAGYPDPSRPPASQTPQQADPYYYYRGYATYPTAYQQPYPPADPRASHLYYQEAYGAYDPAYRQYSNSGFVKYPYQEPERPSSRSSHCSDRPSSRQGYSAPANYYADYYQSQYDYGDPSRWDRYPGAFDPGYRDPRSSYWNYMYGRQEDPYQQKVPYAYNSRLDAYDDRWQYDPRYVRGFDDENEAQRDLAKDDYDRRSVHSENSARSLHSERSSHSRRSSFSSRSQQSQVYKSEQDLTANAYGSQLPNPPLGEFPYGLYPNDYSGQQDTYQYDYQGSSEWQPVDQVPSRSMTPEKYGSPHVCAHFGPGGYLIKVLPYLPSDGQPTLVEIHNMEIIMQNSPEQEQLRSFPGPLVKDETHKVDVINFAQNKAKECSQNESLIDQESARLLWDFIVLLCRQNGTVVGTDIAELLLQDHRTVWLPGKSPNEANLIDFTNEAQEQEESGASQLSFLADMLPNSGVTLEKETERFRELLLFGRKKDALESAMKHGLWGHALLLASKMDSRTHARVMTRFANSLPINDPLQTVYQLLSGRMPAAATCCGDEKWGDWRPHLAMVLSNITNNVDVPARTITTMGDTLASRGLLDAAHFCYLMAQAGFGVYAKKTTKLVLIGSNHSLPFAKFATNEAIWRTEAYEYAQSLGAQTISLPNIQVFKFIYACRLAEHGLSAQAFHYCEVISKTILRHPSYYSPVLISQLLEVASHLRFFDPQLKEKPEQELFVEPPWLLRLRHLDMQVKQGAVVYSTGRTTPQQYACSTPSSEHDHVIQSDGMMAPHETQANTDNPLLANMMPADQGVQLALPGPENSSSLYQHPPVSEPSYSGTTQNVVPSPPISGPAFVPYSSEQVPIYTPALMEPTPTPPRPMDFAPQEQWNQESALQRPPQNSPTRTMLHDTGFDFYGEMAKMAPGHRSRTVSQSSSHMRRTRTTSESSTHSIESTRRSSVGMQPSPPPPAIPEMDKKEAKVNRSSQGSGRSWFPLKIGWLMGKGKNEAHLPDDRNKSIVWDEHKQRWINQDEPEGEENKVLPPPPSGMPKRPQTLPPGPGGMNVPPNPSVNVFSIKAGGPRGRYVDVLNPGGSKPTSSVPPPADLFAPLAPMAIPTNLFVPNSVPEQEQPSVGSEAEMAQPADQPGFDNGAQTQNLNAAPGSEFPASNQEDYPSGEAPVPGPPTGAVTFYNPSNFAQPSSAARTGRLGQRKYPSLK